MHFQMNSFKDEELSFPQSEVTQRSHSTKPIILPNGQEVQQDIHVNIEELTEEEFRKLNILDQLRYLANKTTVNTQKTQMSMLFASALFCLTAVSLIYLALKYYHPLMVEAFQLSPQGAYNLKVFGWFLFVNVMANWFCTICYSSSTSNKHPIFKSLEEIHPPPGLDPFHPEDNEDRPWLKKTLWTDYDETVKRCQSKRNLISTTVKNKGAKAGSSYMLPYEPEPDSGLQWRYCLACRKDAPPRCHHCPVCQLCVLKRDHHCYMTGVCIGYYNQRYFLVCCFHLIVATLLGLYCNYLHMGKTFYVENFNSWWDVFLPYAFYKWIYMQELPLDELIMLSHWYVIPPITIMAMGFFCMQWTSIVLGQTVHEFRTSSPIVCDLSIKERIQDVFGQFWIVAFIFPSQILFPQTGDGISWPKLYYKKYAKSVPRN